MRLALVALALTLPAAAAASPGAGRPAVSSPICGADMKIRPVGAREGTRLKRLGELPPGELTLTVVDRVGACIEPRVVRQGYGALGRAKER